MDKLIRMMIETTVVAAKEEDEEEGDEPEDTESNGSTEQTLNKDRTNGVNWKTLAIFHQN